jgi:predicted PilT family ATPase
MNEDYHPTVDDEAYTPTYAEAFPPLRTSMEASQANGDRTESPLNSSPWGASKMSVRSSTTTQVFCVPLEERRYKEMTEQQFGKKGGQQASICSDIMAKTAGVAIEMSMAKDQSLTVVITGKVENVMKARKMVVQQLQTQAHDQVKIPKEHHRYILGPKGKKLADLELKTATKISVPRAEENSDLLTITGTRDGIERARHEIQLISDEQAKLAFERLSIPKEYHVFIAGPEQINTKTWMEDTGARISIPPPFVMKNEVVVSGEKEGVRICVNNINKIYEEKRHNCQTVSVEVRKSQHKYVIGPRGSNLDEILAETGVAVEVPPLDSTSETITLRGEQDKLGPALTMVYSKANSVVIKDVQAPSWLHRFIIGKKGVTVRKITQDFPKVHIEFTEGEDKISVEGPPAEVEQAKAALEAIINDLLTRMAFVELNVDPKYHRHIIGKSGANVARIKNETGVSIRVPADSEQSSIIRIEGSPEGVARAKQELMEMVNKMENEKSRDILIDQRFHRTLIGAQGGRIREIRDRFNQVVITFPDPGLKSDVVTLRGPRNDVDKCHRYLQQALQEMLENNYSSDVHIFKQFHKNIIGKGGANIRKIRDETDTRIDLPSENNTSDVITITGKKENVEKAKKMIEDIQKELANIKEVSIDIPHKFHNSIIGTKGRLIHSIMEECGGVIIRFPPEGSTSDKVIIRGPTDDVEKARKELLELANERKESGFTAEIHAKPAYHKFLIGRGGSTIREVRDRTGARIIFPTAGDQDQETITILGKKEAVEQAKAELEDRIKDLDNIVEMEINVDPKHHRYFVARRGGVLRQIATEYGGVTVSFPRSGVASDRVVLKGAKDCVEGARNRILEIVRDLEAQVSVECVIPQKFHRTVMGSKGYRVQEITREFDVGIKFPDRPVDGAAETAAPQTTEGGEEQPLVNGDTPSENGGTNSNKQDTIIITGKEENCQAAKEALLALVPITEEMAVPFDFHRFIIGQRGKDVRKMMDEYDVNISIPPAEDQSNLVKITGPAANVERAKQAMEDRVKQLEDEREDRELRNYKLELHVDPAYHPKIIGRRGAVITKIRDAHDVNIQFPEKNSEKQDLITITGYEANSNAAKADILKIVQDLDDMVTEEVHLDHRVHPRLIGGRGRAIRKVMDDYKVDIKFPSRDSDNPDLVLITGSEENVLDCKDHLLNLEEEYMQDVMETEDMQRYMKSPSREEENRGNRGGHPAGFFVRDAPWSAAAPDTSSTADFPGLGSMRSPAPVEASSAAPKYWGPKVKR